MRSSKGVPASQEEECEGEGERERESGAGCASSRDSTDTTTGVYAHARRLGAAGGARCRAVRTLLGRNFDTSQHLAARQAAQVRRLRLGQRRDIASDEVKRRLEAVQHEHDARGRHPLMARGRELVEAADRAVAFVALVVHLLLERAALFRQRLARLFVEGLPTHQLLCEKVYLLLLLPDFVLRRDDLRHRCGARLRRSRLRRGCRRRSLLVDLGHFLLVFFRRRGSSLGISAGLGGSRFAATV